MAHPQDTVTARTPRSISVRNRVIAEAIRDSGETPLEILVRAMRDHVTHADQLRAHADALDDASLLGSGAAVAAADARRAALLAIANAAALARDAAPYMHAKLNTVNANHTGSITLSHMSDAEIRAELAVLAAASALPDDDSD